MTDQYYGDIIPKVWKAVKAVNTPAHNSCVSRTTIHNVIAAVNHSLMVDRKTKYVFQRHLSPSICQPFIRMIEHKQIYFAAWFNKHTDSGSLFNIDNFKILNIIQQISFIGII